MIDLLHGAIDTHVHGFPDVIPRKLDDLELVEQARAAGLRALVLECHHGCTCGRAYLLNRLFSEIRVFGGVVLNDAVGGLSWRAVEAALKMGARQVWMPTKSAANHQRRLGGRGGLEICPGGRLREEVRIILEQIAEADVILATGHISPEESRVLLEEAMAAGVRRISVTHPEWGVTAMPIEVQRRFAPSGRVFFERCLVSTQHDVAQRVEFDVIAAQIRAVGADTTVLGTDYGMPGYPAAPDGLRDYVERLLQHDFTPEQVRTMCQRNPARMLRLEEAA